MRLRLIKLISFCFISIYVLVIFGNISLAQTESPGIKITEPVDGSTVVPSEEITVTVESIGGFALKEGWVSIGRYEQEITSLPSTIIFTIPNEVAGKIILDVLGKDSAGNFAAHEVSLNVQQTATLVSLKVSPDELWFEVDWNGNITGGIDSIQTVYGIYSDGIKRDLTKGAGTTFTSSDPSVISIDSDGKAKAYKAGEARITISNPGISKVIPVVFLKPTGIKPLETIPPTTQIDIQPPANQAGWYNSDVTVTITATDNEGGSGIREILYQLNSLGAKENYVETDTARIFISSEGYDRLNYVAMDKERNGSVPQTVEFNLDKTPPEIKLDISPNILWPPDHKMVDVKINGTATDKLSGVASTNFKVTDEYGQVEPAISKFGDTIQLEAWRKGDDLDGRTYTISVTTTDYAGNKVTVFKTVTVPHDMRN